MNDIDANSSVTNMSNDCDVKKSIIDRIEIIVKISTLVFAAVWFFLQGDPLRRANISQKVSSSKLDSTKNIITVEITLKNCGKRIITVKNGEIRIQQISPLLSNMTSFTNSYINKIPFTTTTSLIPWPYLVQYDMLKDDNIRPGEEETYSYQFIVKNDLELVRVHSYINYDNNKGWRANTVHNIKGDDYAKSSH